jgi:hypothetical protein
VALLPPTLTLQYHFSPESASFRPYVGAGVNYTRFYDINLLAGAATVDKSSWGGALQLGADIPLNKTFFLNIDSEKNLDRYRCQTDRDRCHSGPFQDQSAGAWSGRRDEVLMVET